MNGGAHGGGQRERFDGGADHQFARRESGAGLALRQIHLRSDRRVHRLLAHIADDADDHQPGLSRFSPAELEAFAQGFLARPILARHGFVDERDPLVLFVIQRVEITPAAQRHAQRLQVIFGHLPVICVPV